ncbi:Gfo/Idh/MocA family oxidoreductase [Flavobacteriaceae bacterium XHP0103]|uniref:Gfo/Idh/MocA family protein n=1 Tax=Marixanthotalea marina TaxID=2844359 RepID=UPI002989F76D|nr:Gfo/Idh/MocA family oxidoreductase [Marixanthotalea marina]MBU3821571.1 Gfo/Idh/MocA family oxidoreductase [Marixanthotalea marina]
MTQKPQQKKIKWGIIGLGGIAHKFANDLITIEDAELYAVASRSQEKADEFAQQYGATKAYASYEDLANDPNIEAVYIATPHALHKDNALMCLEKDIAVLGEKPFAMNAQEVDEMIAKAKEKNVLLMEALWTYFLPHYQYVLKELENKTYGNILKIESDFGFTMPYDTDKRLFNKSMGGGSLLDIGIYPIFSSLSTLGMPNSIEAKADFFENGTDSSCDMIFSYDNDIKSYLKSTIKEVTPTEAIFYCENGTIKINREFHIPTTVTIIANGEQRTIDFGYNPDIFGYRYEAVHFNQLLRAGKTESDIMTFDFSKKLIKLLDDVREIINLEY